MDIQALEKIGLTKGEIKTYLSLLKLGECTITPLVKDAKISKSKVYDILDRLSDKGLVGHIIKVKKKVFYPSDPIKILEYLQKKEEEFNEEKKDVELMLPVLREQQKEAVKKQVAVLYDGINGYKTAREELLDEMKSGETLLVIGAPALANIKFEAWLLEFHKKREKRRIGMKIIYNSNAKQFGEKRKKFGLTQVKYMQNNTITPSWIEIFDKSILIGVISEDYLFSFIIRDAKVADSFKSYFELMWKIAR